MQHFHRDYLLSQEIRVPFRKDRDINRGGNFVYVREYIPSRELKYFGLKDNVEEVFVEINLRKSKWLLLAAYKPPSLSKIKLFDVIGNALDYYSKKYHHFLVIGDLTTLEFEDGLQDSLKNEI